jgi:mitochondrial chaperone BCS1
MNCAHVPRSIDDLNLARMISETPARCILLLEDLDCAFPHSRDDDSDDEPERDSYGWLMPGHERARSKVTLSGLLNVLDSISSEEGRVTFATVCLILLTIVYR